MDNIRTDYMQARQKFPILEQYIGAWPAEDFATMYLKNTSADHRRATKTTGIRDNGKG